MSFPTDTDPSPGTAPDPPLGCACYPADNTPLIQYLCMFGVKIGTLWGAPDIPPPNGTFALNQVAACFWQAVIGGVTYNYVSRNGFAAVSVIKAPDTIFLSIDFTLCTFWFPTILIGGAGRKYHDGQVKVVSLIEDMDFSERDFQNSIGFDPGLASYAEPHPISVADTSVHVLSRAIDHSNVRVKILT